MFGAGSGPPFTPPDSQPIVPDMRALSIRQPYAELILRGIKTIEYRSRRTRIIGERFYIYAARTPGDVVGFAELASKGDGGKQRGRESFSGAGLSPSIPDRSKRLDLGFPGGVRLVLGTLGGTVRPNEPGSQASGLRPQASPPCVPTLIVGRSGLSLD